MSPPLTGGDICGKMTQNSKTASLFFCLCPVRHKMLALWLKFSADDIMKHFKKNIANLLSAELAQRVVKD